jgi:hypothetical protein
MAGSFRNCIEAGAKLGIFSRLLADSFVERW